MNSNYTLKDFAILVVLFVLTVCLMSCSDTIPQCESYVNSETHAAVTTTGHSNCYPGDTSIITVRYTAHILINPACSTVDELTCEYNGDIYNQEDMLPVIKDAVFTTVFNNYANQLGGQEHLKWMLLIPDTMNVTFIY